MVKSFDSLILFFFKGPICYKIAITLIKCRNYKTILRAQNDSLFLEKLLLVLGVIDITGLDVCTQLSRMA